MRKIMVSLAVTLILAGVIEIGLRAAEWKNPKHKNPWPPKQIETAPRLAPAYFYNPTGRGDYTADIDSVVVEFKYAPLHFRTNNEGFLGPWEFDEKKKTILAIGASEPIWLRRYPLMAGDYKEKTTRIDVPEVYTETQAGIGHLSRFGYYLVAKAVLGTLLREKLLNES